MVPHDVRLRLRGIATTPAQAAARLSAIQARIDHGQPITESLRLRLDLHYLATGSGPADYEPSDDNDNDEDW